MTIKLAKTIDREDLTHLLFSQEDPETRMYRITITCTDRNSKNEAPLESSAIIFVYILGIIYLFQLLGEL